MKKKKTTWKDIDKIQDEIKALKLRNIEMQIEALEIQIRYLQNFDKEVKQMKKEKKSTLTSKQKKELKKIANSVCIAAAKIAKMAYKKDVK